MFNDISSPLALLQTRRSGKPRDLVAPGPDESQLRTILEVAMRTPDHGKLAPWRFVVVGADQRDAGWRIGRQPVVGAQAHAPEPDGGHHKAVGAEGASAAEPGYGRWLALATPTLPPESDDGGG